MKTTPDPDRDTADLRRRAEDIARHRTGRTARDPTSLSPAEMQKALHDLRTYQIELELQNEELHRTQTEADAARARYFDLYDLAPAGYLTLSEAGQIMEANLTSATLLGVERGALAGQPITRFILREDQDTYYLSWKKLLQTGTPTTCDLRVVKSDGSRLWVQLAATVVRDDGGARKCRVVMSDITELKVGEEALAVSEANLHSLIESTEDIIVSRDREGRAVVYNEAFVSIVRKMFGVSIAPGQRTGDWLPAERKDHWEGVLAKVLAGEVYHEEFTWPIDGIERRFDMTLTPIRVGGKVIGTVEFTRDVTERRRTEEHLHQSQKIETVGRLAGGVAHDFNNMLQVILSNVEILWNRIEAGGPLAKHVLEIRHAADRSADLTGQLLAFARRQTVSPKVLDLNEAVARLQDIFRRLIGEDIRLAFRTGPGLGKVRIDPAQLVQVLVNLVVNARDAIGSAGRITLETANVTFDRAYCAAHPEATPGEYVKLVVSDDGRGMDRETMSHLFEPFFTTKVLGKGTGLGLATVYGIVKQNKGHISVISEPGKGTTFEVCLPRAGDATAEQDAESADAPPKGTETVLVVEDEGAILELTRESLSELGYTVLATSSPEEAMRMAESHAGQIALLVTDVVMPQMNGRQLCERLRAGRAGLKCLYVSGYTEDVIAHRGLLEEKVSFLAKPFSHSALGRKVREVLDG